VFPGVVLGRRFRGGVSARTIAAGDWIRSPGRSWEQEGLEEGLLDLDAKSLVPVWVPWADDENQGLTEAERATACDSRGQNRPPRSRGQGAAANSLSDRKGCSARGCTSLCGWLAEGYCAGTPGSAAANAHRQDRFAVERLDQTLREGRRSAHAAHSLYANRADGAAFAEEPGLV
jgi:hypothetical protein